MHILLLHPPQAKAVEPPAGIPLLAASLKANHIGVTCCDLNIEGLYFLLEQEVATRDTWSQRAAKNRFRHLTALTDPAIYSHRDKHTRAVADLNRHLDNCGRSRNIQLSLANYNDPSHSPLKSGDLLNCAANFRQNIYHPFFARRLTGLISDHQITHVGISLNFLSQAPTTFAILGFLRENFPDICLLLGGGLVTTWLQRPHRHQLFQKLVDHLLAGPGENLLVELLAGRSPGKRYPPDYSAFHQYRYLAPGFILPYASATGCFWRKCSFCPETSEQNPYRPVPPRTGIAEIHELVDRHRPVLIHFLDNAISPAMLHELAAAPPGPPWYGFVRFTKELANPQFCHQLRKAGCVMLKLGLESGSQQVLDAMGKGIDLELVSQVFSALHQAGIATYVYLLFGTTTETLEEARQTLAFVRKHHQAISFLNLAIFNLPLDSPEAAGLSLRDFYQGDLSIYSDFAHPKGWNRKAIRHFLDHEFKREPTIRKIIANDPLSFTSNHAPFFVSG